MKKLKKIVGTAVFLTIIAVSLLTASYILRPVTAKFRLGNMAGFYAQQEDTLDVVSIGSSALYRYLNVVQLWEEQGFTSYNVSTPGQPVAFIKYMMDEVDKTQDVQLYVVECRSFLKTPNNSESMVRRITDAMPYSINRLKILNEMTVGKEDRLSYYLDLIKYHDEWKKINENSFKRLTNTLVSQTKGWEELGKVKPQTAPNIISEEETLPLLKEQEEALRDLIEKCKSEGKQVLFVATPYSISEEEQKKYNYLREIVEESGYLFLDCNRHLEEMGLDFGKDFYNSRHTNALGAEKVTRFIGEFISGHYSLNTDHDEAVVKDWDSAVEIYKEKHERAKAKIYIKVGETE